MRHFSVELPSDELQEQFRPIRAFWLQALRVTILDACGRKDSEDRQVARMWFTSVRYERDWEFYEHACGLHVGTIFEIGLELQRRGWEKVQLGNPRIGREAGSGRQFN